MNSTTDSDPDVLVVTPSAVHTSANLCAAAFLRWTHRNVTHPPRAYALAGGQLKAELREAGVTVVEVPRSSLRTIERALLRAGKDRWARGVRKVLHRFLFTRPPRPDVVLAIGVQGAGPVLRHISGGTRLVTYCYENGQTLDDLVDGDMLARLMKGTTAWVAATDEIASDLIDRGASPEAVSTVRPFIDGPHVDRARSLALRASLGLGPDDVLVGGIGNPDWRDGPDLFIRTAAVLRKRHGDLPVRFVWVGAPDDGPTRWILDHDIHHAGLDDTVTLAGSLDEAESWVAALDVLLVTSRVDPPPPSMLQAGAVGKPVVAFALDGIDEVVRDVRDGDRAVAAIDYLDVEAMAEAVADLVIDPEARSRGGAALQDHVLGHQLTDDAAPELWDLLVRVAGSEA